VGDEHLDEFMVEDVGRIERVAMDDVHPHRQTGQQTAALRTAMGESSSV
jgi:hypothetical protein